MEYYEITVEIDGIITEYYVIPNFSDDRDSQYGVFRDNVFICLIWFELDINGIVWRADHKIMRQEVIDLLGERIESLDL